jgi:hypothetical protein
MRMNYIGRNIIRKIGLAHMPVKKTINMRKVIFILAMLVVTVLSQAQSARWMINKCSIMNNISEQEVSVPVKREFGMYFDYEKDKIFLLNQQYSTYRIDSLHEQVTTEGIHMEYYYATDEEFIQCKVCVATYKENLINKVIFMVRYSDITVTWYGKAYNKKARKSHQNQIEL